VIRKRSTDPSKTDREAGKGLTKVFRPTGQWVLKEKKISMAIF
jgi:hypothetical protein